MATNVPKPTFGENGFEVPDEATEVLPAVQTDINDAFGGGLNPALETPQGQLASSIAALVGNANDTFLYYTNQVDPAYATGRMQDAIARIYFIERKPSTPTVVQATCTGLAGVVITVGALAQAADGNIYSCTQQGVIPESGSITLPFACLVPGPITCAVNSLNTIYTAIPGWDDVNNLTDGVIGDPVESRREFEARRWDSVAKNSMGFLPSVLGAVLAVPDVIDAYVTENPTGGPIDVGNVTIAARSIYVAVVGGEAEDVARAIWTKKSPGCGYNGSTTVTVYDDQAGYDPPYPSYQVSFVTPAPTPVLFSVTLTENNQVPSNVETLVRDAIIAAFAGEDGGIRARIGSDIYASRYYAPVAALGSWVQIVSIDLGTQNTPEAKFTAAISNGSGAAGNQLAVSAVESGTIASGQTVVGAGILPGTTITGGSGMSWTVSPVQLVASETMYGVLTDQHMVEIEIDQGPTVSADDITVTLVEP